MCGLCVRWARGKGVLLPAREQEVLSPGQKQFGSSWNRVAVQTGASTREEAGANTNPPYDFHGGDKSPTLGSSFLVKSVLWVSCMVALPLIFWS